MQPILRRLLDELDIIAEQHEEIGDTDVRRLSTAAAVQLRNRFTSGTDSAAP